METQQDFGNNVKLGIGFDCCDGSTLDSNGQLGLEAWSKFTFCMILHWSELIAWTVAELVNKEGASRVQSLPR